MTPLSFIFIIHVTLGREKPSQLLEHRVDRNKVRGCGSVEDEGNTHLIHCECAADVGTATRVLQRSG